MVRKRAILGFCVGAVGGWTLGSSLMHAGRSLEAPGDRVEDGATGEAPNIVQVDSPASDEQSFKDARSRIDERVRELGGRRSEAA